MLVLSLVFILAINPNPMTVHVVPVSSFRYSLEVDGTRAAGFSEIRGLTNDATSAEYRAGTGATTQVVPGHVKYQLVTLKRGTVSGSQLFDWFKSKVAKSVVLNGALINGHAASFHMSDCTPVSYTGPTLGSKGSSDVAMEELVLSCERITLVK